LLSCSGDLGAVHFQFSRETSRYLHVYTSGYVDLLPGFGETDESSITPFIEIGKCSRL
jgi:hypothetical protein